MKRLMVVIALLAATLPLLGQSKPDIEWRSYGNDAGGSHYSKAAEINRENVAKLQAVWTYHTGALEPVTDLNKKAAFEATAVMSGGTLYVSTPFDKVIALDPPTGKERWSFDPQVDPGFGSSEVTSRSSAVRPSGNPVH